MSESLYPQHASGELPKVTGSGVIECAKCGANMLLDKRPHTLAMGRLDGRRVILCLDCDRPSK